MALKEITAEAVANALVSVYSRLGIPSEILTDQGRQFTAECMKEVNRLLQVKHLLTTPYHPMCNGLVENFNKTLKNMIRRTCEEQPKNWHLYLDLLLFAYREVPQATTGFSPFELLYGRSVRGPLSILEELWSEDSEPSPDKIYYEYFLEIRERLSKTLEITRQEINKSQETQKHYYDKRTKKKDISPGDEVLVLLPTDANKMKMKWKGPYKVESEPHVNDFYILVRGKKKLYHANMLKKYFRRKEDRKGEDAKCAIAVIEDDEEEMEGSDLHLIEIESKESVYDVNVNSDLEEHQKQELNNLLNKYYNVFTTIPGTTNLVKHSIKLTTDEPVVCKPYPLPFSSRNNLRGSINEI